VDSLAVERWWNISTELADKYQPDLYYFDWGWNLGDFKQQHRMDFLTHYYNKALDWEYGQFPAPNVVVNYKNRKKLPVGSAVLDLERGGMKTIEKFPWQNDTSLGLKSWSYAADEEYRSANQVVDMLMDIIAKNGVLLLNIGPKADGTIPPEATIPIKNIGKWLQANGEAVYATRPWTSFGEGPTVPNEKMHGDQVEYTAKDIRFTCSKDKQVLYATFLGWPSQRAIIPSLRKGAIDLESLRSVTLLQNGKTAKWTQQADGLHLQMPSKTAEDEFAYAFKLTFKEKIPTLGKAKK